MSVITKKTKDRLETSLRKVHGWASAIPFEEHKWFEEYLSGQGKVRLAVVDVFRLGMGKVGAGLLAAEKGVNFNQATHDFVHAFKRMIYAKAIEFVSGKDTGNKIIGNLDDIAHWMLGALATGQPKLVGPMLKVIFDGFERGYGVDDGHNPPIDTTLRYAAFGLSIICNWLDQPLDLDKQALPRDPGWGLLVAHWREPDPAKFLPILIAICDIHVQRIALTERESNSGKFEFDSAFLAVHPTEILAVLRLREILGLANPRTIDHPLMQTPYAPLTCKPGEVTERDELLDQFIAVVRQRDPQWLPSGF